MALGINTSVMPLQRNEGKLGKIGASDGANLKDSQRLSSDNSVTVDIGKNIKASNSKDEGSVVTQDGTLTSSTINRESSIEGVNFEKESSSFDKMQVLNRSGSFSTAQANASAQGVLNLV